MTESAYRAPRLLPMALQWLRETYPDALLVPELCVGNWGAASLDVGAVTDTEIIGVEIKGDGDSPARLDRQGLAYGMVATRMWLLPSPSLHDKCKARRPAGWGQLVVGGDSCAYAGPHMPPARPSEHQSVGAMLGVLWADELRDLWRETMSGSRRPHYAHTLREQMAEQLPLSVVRPFLCRTLRNRDWQAKGKRVIRPNDPLPSHPDNQEQAA